MSKIKKLLAVLALVLMAGSLTACSKINKISNYFEDQGYTRYEYNNRGDSLIFALHDDLASEIEAQMSTTVDTSSTTTTTAVVTTDDNDETTLNYESNIDVPFISYVFSNGEKYVVVIEFADENYMLDLLDTSPSLIAQFEGLDPADFVNGNCLLIVPEVEDFDEMVEIFQGRAEPLVTTATTTEATTDTTTGTGTSTTTAG